MQWKAKNQVALTLRIIITDIHNIIHNCYEHTIQSPPSHMDSSVVKLDDHSHSHCNNEHEQFAAHKPSFFPTSTCHFAHHVAPTVCNHLIGMMNLTLKEIQHQAIPTFWYDTHSWQIKGVMTMVSWWHWNVSFYHLTFACLCMNYQWAC